MPTTREEREAARALIRENLRDFIDEVNAARGDVQKTNLSLSLAGLQIIATVNLAETLEAQPGPP